MKTEQFMNPIKATFKFDRLTQLLAFSSLAFGVVAIIPATSAQAIVLNTGELVFQNGTENFFEEVKPGFGDTFDVTFNPGKLAFVTAASGNFAGPFSTALPSAYSIAPSAGKFEFISGTANTSFNYKLIDNDLKFAFNNGVTLIVGKGSTFQGVFNNLTKGVDFGLTSSIGNSFEFNNADSVPLESLAFGFNDNPRGSSGGYTIGASQERVPEPFTIIGTLVGGTAAFRMRKKLADANNN